MAFSFFGKNIHNQFKNQTRFITGSIESAARNRIITEFEYKLFLAISAISSVSAGRYLESKDLPFHRIAAPRKDYTIQDAFYFLCVVYLHSFLALFSKQAKASLDVANSRLKKDFTIVFGQSTALKNLDSLLASFDTMLKERSGDPRDMWFTQSILFGNIIAEGSANIGDLVKGNILLSQVLFLTVDDLQFIFTQIYEEIVLGIQHSPMGPPPHY